MDGIKQLIDIVFQRHQTLWNTLEMVVIRGRCATLRAIVEK